MSFLIQDKSEQSNYNKIEVAIQNFMFSWYVISQSDRLVKSDWYNINLGDELSNFDTQFGCFSELDVQHYGYNLVLQSLGNMFLSANKALEDEYGKYQQTPINILPLRRTIAAGRNAFAHDTGTPRFYFKKTPYSEWEYDKTTKQPITWNFSSPTGKYNYSIDWNGKHDKILQLKDFSGIEHMMALFIWTKQITKPDLTYLNKNKIILTHDQRHVYHITDSSFNLDKSFEARNNQISWSLKTFIDKPNQTIIKSLNCNRLITFRIKEGARICNISNIEEKKLSNECFDYSKQLASTYDIINLYDVRSMNKIQYFILNKNIIEKVNDEIY